MTLSESAPVVALNGKNPVAAITPGHRSDSRTEKRKLPLNTELGRVQLS